MTNYTITYRADDGSIASTTLEAADRAACVAACRARGITPVSIKEGAAKSKGGAKSSGVFSPAKERTPQTSTHSNSHAFIRTLALVLALVAIGAVVWFFFLRTPTESMVTSKPEVKPKQSIEKETAKPVPSPREVVTNKPTAMPIQPKKADTPWKIGETRDGYILLPSGRKHKVVGVITNSANASTKAKYEIFHHHIENEIASLLTMKPGETIIGTPRYSQNLKQEFLKSLENPIIIHDDDPDEIKELKNAMLETKQQIKDRIDAGEDLAQILQDTRQEYQELAQYRHNIETEFAKLRRRADVTDQDLDDFVQAANAVLAKKGIAPLKIGPITRRRLKMKDMHDGK